MLTIVLVAFVFTVAKSNAQNRYLETIKVTESVYVFKPKIDFIHGNGTAIIGPDGVFFIDTYQQTNYAEEAIKLLKKITNLPVKYVLNTHWHNDHVFGNYIFKKTFPGCQIIAQDSTYEYMETNIKNQIDDEKKGIDDGIDQLQKDLKNGKTPNGAPIKGDLEKFWKLQMQEELEYKNSFKGNHFANADITFSDTLTFHWGAQTIQLIHAADNGHSSGDVVAWLREKRILIAGDLAVGPTPYATYDNIPGMVKAIQRLLDMKPAIIIPGHGVVEYDLTYLKLVQAAFEGYIKQAEEDIKNKIPVKDAIKNARLGDIDDKFTGDDDIKKWAYHSFFVSFIIYYAYKHEGALPAK